MAEVAFRLVGASTVEIVEPGRPGEIHARVGKLEFKFSAGLKQGDNPLNVRLVRVLGEEDDVGERR